jgi:hypothetical protein
MTPDPDRDPSGAREWMCSECQEKPRRKGGRQCSACYKRRAWVHAYRQRTGGEFRAVNGAAYFYQHDDIKLLWRANRELEKALAQAHRRETLRLPDEGGGDDGAEW